MLKNFFKIALRHLRRHKLFTFLNLTGLTIAFTCSFLIFLYVRYELSYDRYHKNAGNIYRVVQRQAGNNWRGTDLWNATTSTLKPVLVENFSEIEKAAIVNQYYARIFHNNRFFEENKYYAVEPEFLEIFSFPLVKGDIKTVLSKPKSLLITETTAKKYFDNKDPIGEILVVNDIEHTITGVLKDIPKNSHFTFDFLASFINLNAKTWEEPNQGGPRSWQSNNFTTYIEIKEGVEPVVLENKITEYIKELKVKNAKVRYQLQKITDIHLYSHANAEFEANSDIKYVYIFSGIAILLLLIAAFNYMNLNTVQTLHFAKEVGVRKVTGAKSKQISFQYFGESILTALFAVSISIILIRALIPVYSNFVERELSFTSVFSPLFIIPFLAAALLIGFISGSYPAFILSRNKPLSIMAGKKISGLSGMGIRNGLIVTQFVISIALIMSSFVLHKQIHFVVNKKLGYHSENIISIDVADAQLRDKYEIFKNEVLKHPGISDVTYAQTSLEYNNWGGGGKWEGKQPEENIPFYTLYVDYNFFEFFDISLAKGRFFQPTIPTDNNAACILNKTGVEAIGWEDPLNKNFSAQNISGRVIGVVNNFHFQSLHLGIEPLAIALGKHSGHKRYFSVKIASDQTADALSYIEDTYKKMSPAYQFNYAFLDDKLESLYKAEQRQGNLFSFFTAIAIIVAVLGLFGLASFVAEQRTKEIGVRKVNGAKIYEILAMLNIDFIMWVIIAFIIATPVAWLAMNKWLENFAYKTPLSWWIFVLAGLLALVIALLTVSFQSYRAAIKNPIESLRYE